MVLAVKMSEEMVGLEVAAILFQPVLGRDQGYLEEAQLQGKVTQGVTASITECHLAVVVVAVQGLLEEILQEVHRLGLGVMVQLQLSLDHQLPMLEAVAVVAVV